MHKTSPFTQYKGLTLLELLLALTLSCFVMGSIASIYSLSKANTDRVLAISEVENNAMMALHFIESEVQMTGYSGCRSGQKDFLTNAIEMKRRGQNDVLVLHQMSADIIELNQDMTSHSDIVLQSNLKADPGDLAIISDCEGYETFYIDSIHSAYHHLHTAKPLKRLYKRFAQLALWQTKIITIQKTTRSTRNGKPVFSLYEKIDSHPSLEWVEGVNDLRIQELMQDNQLIGLKIQMELESVTAYPFTKTFTSWISLPNAR